MAQQGEQYVNDPDNKRFAAGPSVKDQGIWTEQNYDKNLLIGEKEPYEVWADLQELAGPDRDLNADTDGDGLNQDQEWKFGKDPNRSDLYSIALGEPIAQHIESGYVELVFDRLLHYQNYRLDYIIETSEDLVSWLEVSGTVQPWPVTQPDGLLEKVTVRLSQVPAPRMFYRLRVRSN